MANLPKRDVKLIAHPHEEPTRQQFRERPAKGPDYELQLQSIACTRQFPHARLTFGALDRCFISDRFDV
jgi:hypothetical protein